MSNMHRKRATNHPASPAPQAPEGGRFLKGLAVLDDVAYLGVSTWAPREIRGSPGHACEIAAYDLEGRRLLWRRRVETAGLLNAIAAPHLGEDSSYRAVYSLTRLPAGGGAGGAAARGGAAVAAEVAARLEQLGLGPMVRCRGGLQAALAERTYGCSWFEASSLAKLITLFSCCAKRERTTPTRLPLPSATPLRTNVTARRHPPPGSTRPGDELLVQRAAAHGPFLQIRP